MIRTLCVSSSVSRWKYLFCSFFCNLKYYFTPLWVFPLALADSLFFFTGVWVTSLPKSPEVFWTILVMMKLRWFPLVFLFSCLPVPFWNRSKYITYNSYYRQLRVLFFSSKIKVFISLRFSLILLCGLPQQQSPLFRRFCFSVYYHKVWSSDRVFSVFCPILTML